MTYGRYSASLTLIPHGIAYLEEDRTPVGRPDFKSGEARATCLVGSTPTLFRPYGPYN